MVAYSRVSCYHISIRLERVGERMLTRLLAARVAITWKVGSQDGEYVFGFVDIRCCLQ